MKRSFGLLAVLALLGGAAAGVAAQGQGSTAPRRSYIIGCIARDGKTYVLKDFRGGAFKLEGNLGDFDWHVGHKLEVSGTFGAAPDSFRVESVTYISTTCQ